PFPPWPLEAMAEHLETAEALQQLATFLAISRKLRTFRRALRSPERRESGAQRRPFQRCNAFIIDMLALPDLRERSRVGPILVARRLLDIDVECIEKQPAVRRVGAEFAGPVIEQRMQRIEADAFRTEFGGQCNQTGEIGEIPHAPITPRTDAVEL